MLVEKEVISPGTYWYVDERSGVPRKWDVTAATTKYLHEQGQKMVALGLPIPIPFEHDFNAHPMTPKDRLLSNAGEVKDYRMRGDTLFSVCDITDADARKKIGSGSVRWTSPWITSFTDGSGREWNNVIGHLALTTRPRVTKQAPFPSIAAAMTFALSSPADVFDASRRGPTEGFTVSKAHRLVERTTGKSKRLRPQYPMAFSLSTGIKLAEEDLPPPKKKAPPTDDAGGDADAPPPDADAAPDAAGGDIDIPDAPGMPDDLGQESFADAANDVGMEELLADLLGALGIHLEKGGSEQQFQRNLYNAAMTKIHELTGKAQNGGADPNQQNQPPNGQPPNPLMPQVKQEQQPMYMSLEQINGIEDPTMKTIALSMYHENAKLRGALDANTKAVASMHEAELKKANARRQSRVNLLGRMLPSAKADLDADLASPAMALSMGDGGTVVDPMARTLAVLEKGLADMPRLLTTPSAALSEQPQPTDADALTEQRADEIAEMQARRMGAPPQQKQSA